MQNGQNDFLAQARDIHSRCVVVDSHCDTTQKLMDSAWDLSERHDYGHVDVPRMREGGIGAVFFAVYAPDSTEKGSNRATAQSQIRSIKRTIQRHGEHVAAAINADDIQRARAEGKIAILIAIEGGHLIEDSLETLREYYAQGATYMTLTHATHTGWADSSGVREKLAPRHGGLTPFGREVIAEMNRLGMMVDVSHVSDATLRDVLEVSTAPVVATHSSCRAVSPHCRNLSDELMLAIASSGGTVQINFFSAFIDQRYPQPGPEALARYLETGRIPSELMPDYVTPLRVLVEHVDHALKLVGADHVGLGSDFDGVFALPADLEDCSKLPNLTAELIKLGYGEDDLMKVLGGNILRVMEACRNLAG